MSIEERIQRLEQEVAQTEHVVHLTERLLAELMKRSQAPPGLEPVRGFLRSAHDLAKHEEKKTAEQLVGQAEESLQRTQEWLAVSDLGISPFFLRSFLEKNPVGEEVQRALIGYFLRKQPHAENDRDKLDYLLTSYLGSGRKEDSSLPGSREKLAGTLQELFRGLPGREISPPSEISLHEFESLIARINDFTDFDELVHARMVERARALKINLGEDFYHPRTLPTILRFNSAFRQRFEQLFQEQLQSVRQTVQKQVGEAWEIIRAIEAACEKLALPESERAGLEATAVDEGEGEGEATVGRPHEILDERPPIDRLIRRGDDPQKEKELAGTLNRLSRFLEKLPAAQAESEKVVFPLREAQLPLARWEREAFRPAAQAAAPQSVQAIQNALGVTAWMEEELARYRRTRGDRYLWKTHFDLLSYAVARALDLLKAIRESIREGAPPAEAAWFNPLLQTSLRLASTLNKVAPVFAESKGS